MPLPTPGPRKEALLSMMPRAALAAEIGADHGILSAHLIARGICDRMIVSDISAASLGKAKRLFAFHGLDGRAAFAVADGLEAITEPVDAILIAGMGAETIIGMLERGKARIGDAQLVLQSNTDLDVLRAWLSGNGFAITGESLSFENRRYYIGIRAEKGYAPLNEAQRLIGPQLLREKPLLFDAYLKFRINCLKRDKKPQAAHAAEIYAAALAGEDLLSTEYAVQ